MTMKERRLKAAPLVTKCPVGALLHHDTLRGPVGRHSNTRPGHPAPDNYATRELDGSPTLFVHLGIPPHRVPIDRRGHSFRIKWVLKVKRRRSRTKGV